jgi:hypothetical protein
MRKTREERPHHLHVSADQVSDLMQALNQNFIHILPKKRVMVQEGAKKAFIPPKVTLELLEQYEVTLQLLVQNILFCDDYNTKQMSIRIFVEIILKKNQLLEQLYLPAYDVFLNDFVDQPYQEIWKQ